MYKQFNQAKQLQVYKEKYDNLLDLTVHPNYGLVDNYGNDIYVKKGFLGYSHKYKIILLENIIPLFEELFDYLNNLKNKNLIDVKNSFLENLTPKFGYVDNDLYETTRLQASLTRFRAYVKFKNLTYKNFDEFLVIFFEATRAGSGGPAQTNSGERVSSGGKRDARGGGVVASGLAALTTPLQPANLYKVYDDKNFTIFHNAAKYFGFFLNLHQPLQLIFNLNTEALNLELDNFFAERYNRTIESELERCFYFLTTIYNILLEENKFHIQHKYNGCETLNIIERKEKAPEMKKVDPYKIYFDYLLSENNIVIKDSDHNKILKVVYALPSIEAVEYIQNVVQLNKQV